MADGGEIAVGTLVAEIFAIELRGLEALAAEEKARQPKRYERLGHIAAIASVIVGATAVEAAASHEGDHEGG